MRETPKNLIEAPVKIGYLTDLYDSEGNHICDIRNWGRLQYFDRGEELQDKMAKFIVDAINEKLEREPLTSELSLPPLI
jgi:hypothetical protein